MAALEEPARISDAILWEADPRYTRASVTFRNTTGSTASFPIFQSLKTSGGKYLPDDGDTCVAMLLQPVTDLANNTDLANVAVLIRGPAIVNEDAITVISGSTVAGVVADLAALSPPIIVVNEPDSISEG